MAAQSSRSPSLEPDSQRVKRALRALAAGDAPTVYRSHVAAARLRTAEATITEATTAFEDVRKAALFVQNGGLERLRHAVKLAERVNEYGLARRGQRTCALLKRYRREAQSSDNMPRER